MVGRVSGIAIRFFGPSVGNNVPLISAHRHDFKVGADKVGGHKTYVAVTMSAIDSAHARAASRSSWTIPMLGSTQCRRWGPMPS